MLLDGEGRLHRAPSFEDRPELGELCAWWRDGGAGICVLVGIGGAGKTAITDRFLRLVPGVLEADRHVPVDPTLPVPARVFVSSFEDTNNAQVFLARLRAWLRGEPFVESGPRPSLHETLDALRVGLAAARGRLLLVLDGVERVQDDRLRGGSLGRITDNALASFISRLAAGLYPGLAAILTTRVPIAELDEEEPPHYRRIQVDGLSVEGAVALLRRHGVRDTGELRAIAEECGRHALTLDLVGGYIRVFGGGDPSARPKAVAPEELKQRIDEEPNAKRRAVLYQERRFARLTAEYRVKLSAEDPAALALLERACLFRLPVQAETLSSIFVGQDKEPISGPALAALGREDVARKLAFLANLHLLDARPTGYATHPAIRDGFLRGLDANVARAGHEATRRSLEVSLAGRPGGFAPSDPRTLEQVEEIIHHTLEAGYVDDAWGIYWSRTGRYGNLGRRLGMAEMGRRICRSFLTSDGEPRLASRTQCAFLLNNLALYHRDLGLLSAAVLYFQRGVAARRAMGGGPLLALGERNLSHAHLLLADTRAAKDHARAALEIDDAPSARMLAGALLARCELLTGNLETAFTTFDATRSATRPVDGAGNLMFYPELWEAETCFRAEDLPRASEIIERALRDSTSGAYQLDRVRFTLLLAEVHEARGELGKAHELLDETTDWAKAHDTRELLGRTAMVRARLLLGEPRRRSETAAQLDEGLRIARESGYGLLHLDLLVVRARLSLIEDRDADARRDALAALYGVASRPHGTAVWDAPPLDGSEPIDARGVFPSPESGLPVLLAATHPACAYAWAERDARWVLAEATTRNDTRVAAARVIVEPASPPPRTPEIGEGMTAPTTTESMDVGIIVAHKQEVRELPRRQPMKHTILYVAANPLDTNRRALDEECAAIERELRMTSGRDDFDFRSKWAVSVDELMRHLNELEPTILHFSGHGSKGDGGSPDRSGDLQRGIAGARSAGILLEEGQARQYVSDRALAKMIASAAPSTRVVVLNACYSAEVADSLRHEVDCIVGIDDAIADTAARSFAVAFYRALGNRRSIGNAVDQAAATLEAKHPGARPMCATRDGLRADQIFLPTVERSRPGPEAQAARTAAASQPRTATAPSNVDIGILTILDDEFRAVLAAFPDRFGTFKGTRTNREYSLHRADGGGGAHYTLALLRQIEQGNGEAQSAARDLIEDFSLRLILVVGIAGGIPSANVTLGDVVLSTRIHDFTVEARTAEEAPTYSTTGGPVSKALAAAIANLPAREAELGAWTQGLLAQPPVSWAEKGQLYGPKDWQAALRAKLERHYRSATGPRPPIYVDGPIASSDRLVKDPELLIPWLQTARKLIAVEMESGGVYRAAQDRCSMLAIRGISDIVGLRRSDDWTKYACASAAAFSRAFLRTRPIELGPAATRASEPSPKATSKTDPALAGHDQSVGPPPTQERRMTPDELFTRLLNLLPPQFEEVLYRARIPPRHLPGPSASQTERAVAAMRYIEQQNQLEQLARIVQQVVTRSGPASSNPR